MKTASFFDYNGPGRISIARWAPKKIAPYITEYPALSPGWWYKSVPKEEYIARYQSEILAKLNPQKVWYDLHELVRGYEPILMCWEKGPLIGNNFCHRTLVAKWFEETLGEKVTEIFQTLF